MAGHIWLTSETMGDTRAVVINAGNEITENVIFVSDLACDVLLA